MVGLDAELLDELGLGALPVAEMDRLLDWMSRTLADRVGTRIVRRLDPVQLAQLEGVIDDGGPVERLRWLETHAPDFRDVVQAELVSLRGQVEAKADRIVDAARARRPPG